MKTAAMVPSSAVAGRRQGLAVRCSRSIEWVVVAMAFAAITCKAFTLPPMEGDEPRCFSNPKTTNPKPEETTTGSSSNSLTHRRIDCSILVGGNNVMDFESAAPMDHQDQDGSNNNNFPTTTTKDANHLDRVEGWLIDRLEECYVYSERHVRCPFFRRRFGDVLDHAEGFVRFFLVRPCFSRETIPSLSRPGPPMSCKPLAGAGPKTKHLAVGELVGVLRRDWRATAGGGGGGGGDDHKHARPPKSAGEKGYCVSGKMSTRIYRDDCEFASPDPDLPLKGLRKYVGVAPHLFESRSSYSKLLSLEEASPGRAERNPVGEGIVLRAEWKLSLTINLPWKPRLSEFSGSTLYFLDEDRLIYRHQEAWDISVLDAFLAMMSVPKKKKQKQSGNGVRKCPLAGFSPQSQTARNNGDVLDCTKTIHNNTVVADEEFCLGG